MSAGFATTFGFDAASVVFGAGSSAELLAGIRGLVAEARRLDVRPGTLVALIKEEYRTLASVTMA